MPYMMLRHATVFGFHDEIREAALLGKAWGMSKQWIAHAVTASAFYMNGMSGVAVAQKALQPIFDSWDGAPDTGS